MKPDEITELIRELGPVIPVQPTSVLFFIKDLVLDKLDLIGAGASLAGLTIQIISTIKRKRNKKGKEKQNECKGNDKLISVRKEFVNNLGIANRILHIYGGPISPSGKLNPYHRKAWLSLEKTISVSTEGRVNVDYVNDILTPLKENGAIFGGPNSNPLTKIAFEFEGKDPKRLNPRKNFEIPFRFFGLSDIEKLTIRDDKEFTMPLKGLGVRNHHNWGFVDRYDTNPHRLYNCRLDSSGKPLNDPLLITKIPNIFSSFTAPRNIVFIDGAHSLGTGAFSLLLQKKNVLEQINSEIQGKESYQILLDTEVAKKGNNYEVEDISLMNLKGPDENPIHLIQGYDFSKLQSYVESRLEEENMIPMKYSVI